MSNFKRFLALALAAMMVVGMMVFTAPAASAYEATGEYKDNITMLNNFGVMLGDGVSFDEKSEVTRWQTALFIARIVTGYTGNDMWTGTKSDFFTDVTADHFPGAIDFCAEMGYIIGVGDNKFEPDEKITYRDALTILVRVLGYETKDTTYPWGYILTARSIVTTKDEYLTEDVDAAFTANLLREELADLLAKAIYVSIGGTTLAKASLKCEDLGQLALVATEKFAVDEKSFAKANELMLDATTPVKVANATKKSDLDWYYYLGAKATVYKIKDTVYADFGDITVSDVTTDANGKAGGVDYTKASTFGTATNKLWVTITAANAKNVSGRAFKVENGKTIFVPFNGLHNVTAIDVTFNGTTGWSGVKKGTLYYIPDAANVAEVKAGTVLKAINAGDASAVKGQFIAGGKVSTSSTGTTARTDIASNNYKESTNLYVSVNGAIKNGEPFYGNITPIGDYTFITVGNAPEIVHGSAVLSAITADQIKLGDTFFSVGYTGVGKGADGWYDEMADFNNDTALVAATYGKTVDYTTVNGKIVSIKLHDEGAVTPATKTYPSSLNKDVVSVVFYNDGTGITVNADNTLTLASYDLMTAKLGTIKVDQINGTNIAKLINDYGVSVAAQILYPGEGITSVSALVKKFLDVNANYRTDEVTITGKKTGFIQLCGVANKTEDVYSINSQTSNVKQVLVGKTTGNAITWSSVDVTFTQYEDAALSTAKIPTHSYNATESTSAKKDKEYYTDDTAKYLTVTKDTDIIILAKDGLKVINEVPQSGQHLLLNSQIGMVLALSNDLIVIVANSVNPDNAKTVAQITDIKSADPIAPVEKDTNWYTLTWTTTYEGCEVVTSGGKAYFNYTFNNMYNMTTKQLEKVVISRTDYIASDVPGAIFGNRWTKGKAVPCSSNTEIKAIITAGGAFYQPFYITGELGKDNNIESSMISWGLYNGYKIGLVTAASYSDLNTLAIRNLKVTENAGSYKLEDNTDNSLDLSVVVDYNLFIYNISTGAGKDEIGSVENETGAAGNTGVGGVITGNSGYQGKLVNNTVYGCVIAANKEAGDANLGFGFKKSFSKKTSAQTIGDYEIVLYKFNEKTGIADVIANFGDGVGSYMSTNKAADTFATVKDVCAKADS